VLTTPNSAIENLSRAIFQSSLALNQNLKLSFVLSKTLQAGWALHISIF
jgi:hypothetical protein